MTGREYGLVVGSPTWWLSTNVPIRSFLESETGSPGAHRQAVRRLRRLPTLLASQPEDRSPARRRAAGNSWPASTSSTRAVRCGPSCRLSATWALASTRTATSA
jgi:hypothetical protein